MLRFLIAFCFFSFQLFQVILTLNPLVQKHKSSSTTTVITARFKRCITAGSDNRTLLDLSGQ